MASRVALVGAITSAALVACTNGGNTPPPNDGPGFVVNSPLDGSQTAGTFFFSVQPLEPAAVRSVRFAAGGADLGADTTAADGFRVFVNAADHAAGALDLTATVTGTNGRTSRATVTVTNLPQPPATGTVGPNGTAVGSEDPKGALSTLVVPPGAAAGTTVAVAPRDEGQVKDETGVDYGALGLTFLGAQQVDASRGFDRPVSITSGGFGPMVQPQQAVVAFRIAPDADGDGVGEIVVINGASVAPNGVLVSDPTPLVQLGSSVTTTGLRGSAVRPLASGVSGPPGTFLELPVSGFNPFAPFGNVAVFEGAFGTVELVGSIHGTGDGSQTFVTTIPAVPAGNATLTLVNLGTGYRSDAVALSITAPPALTGDPVAVIERSLDLMQQALAALDAAAGIGAGAPITGVELGQRMAAAVRARVAELTDAGGAEDLEHLRTLATMLQVGAVDAIFSDVLAELAAQRLRVAQAGCNDILDRADKGWDAIGNVTGVGDLASPEGMPVGQMQGWMLGKWWSWVKATTLGIDEQLGGNACRPGSPPPPGPTQPPSGGRQLQVFGLGGAVPPGGSVGGGAFGVGPYGLPPYALAPQADSGLRQAPGRYVIKVRARGSSLAFSGATDAGGYFYLPFVPADEPFTAVAIDTMTGATRFQDGVGPKDGASTTLYFDFFNDAADRPIYHWDGGGDGTTWTDALNWGGDIVPVPLSDVVLDLPGTDATVVSNGDVQLNSLVSKEALVLTGGILSLASDSTVDGPLTLDFGSLELAGDLTVNGGMTWKRGRVQGAGTLINNGSMAIVGEVGVRELTANLRNAATVVLSGTGSEGLRIGRGITFDNLVGATVDVQTDLGFVHNGDPRATFVNAGTLVKSAGTGTSTWSAFVDNVGGTVAVESGTLHLRWGGSSTGGTFDVDAGASLDLGLGTSVTTLGGTYGGAGPGFVQLTGGTFDIAAAGATFAFAGGGVRWTGGTITGSGSLTNAGRLEIVAGVSSTRDLTGHLTNEADLVLTGAGTTALRAGKGASITNASGATVDIQGDLAISGGVGDPIATFANAGALVKSAGAGEARLTVCYEERAGGTRLAVTGTIVIVGSCPP